jgi:hypothetical protein
VSKPALGRGLGKLMKEGHVPPTSSGSTNQAPVSPGMGVLLRGGNGKPTAAERDGRGVHEPRFRWKRLIQMSLLLADLVLLGLVGRLSLKSHGALGGTDLTFCVVALVLGAGLTCLAFAWDKLGE